MDIEGSEAEVKFEAEDSAIEHLEQKSKKRPKKGKGKKKKKSSGEGDSQTVVEETSEQGAEDERHEKSRHKKKNLGKKKSIETVSNLTESQGQAINVASSEIEDNDSQKQTLQETIIEVRDNRDLEDSTLREVITDSTPKKDLETSSLDENSNNDYNEPKEGSNDEKKDDKKSSDGEETIEGISEIDAKKDEVEETKNVAERRISKKEDRIRRRATLTELGASIDENVEQRTKGLDFVVEETAQSQDEKPVSNKTDIADESTEKPESVAVEISPEGPESVVLEKVEDKISEKLEKTETVVTVDGLAADDILNKEAVNMATAEEPATQPVSDVSIAVDGSPQDYDNKTRHERTGEASVVFQSEAEVTPSVFLEYEVDDELPWAMYRSVDSTGTRQPIEDDDEWPASEEEEDVSPPSNDDLPDLDDLLGTLDSGETQLDTSSPPPPLLEPDEQKEKQRQVHELKVGLAEEPIGAYVDDFEKRMEDEILMIGNISLEEVQEEERRLRDEHIAFQQQQNKQQRLRQEEIVQREEYAKKRVTKVLKEKSKRIQRREEHMMQQDRLIQNRIHRAFRRAEHQLLKALKARKGEVKTMYGDLVMADGQYGGSKGRRWKVDWNKTPQPIQIKLKCLRGVKDKLPSGRYVLMVSLYDRLGGHVLKWSNLKGQQWGGATLPLQHDGEFYNIEIKIDQSVFTVCPAKPDVRPGMVLVFELFILRGSVTPTDRVVGWGCFPICDGEFNIVEGRYKSPFLRGDMDPGIDKHERIEELMAEDLENWLCNLYFEIVRLPRYMAGQKEYEIELQFTSGLVSYPSRTNVDEEFIDGEAPIYGSRSDLKSAVTDGHRRASRISTASSFFGSTMGLGLETATEEKEQSSSSLMNLKVEVPDMKKRRESLAVPEITKEPRRRSSASLTRPMTVHMSRKVMEHHDPSSGSEGSGTDYSDDEVLMLRKDDDFRPVKGQPGMYYKKHKNNPSDVYAKKMFTMIPKTPVLTKRGKRKKKLTHLEELDQHTYSMKQPFSNKGHIIHRGTEKMQYVSRQLLAELGLSQWRSREFWAMMLMIVLTWWIRLYAHYGGQWIFLNTLYIPINKFEFLPYSVNLNYQNTLLHTREEIALVIIGPFTNIIIFCTLIISSWFIQRLFNLFPNILSRFIMAFGINTLLDPIWIFIVDMALLRYLRLGADVPIADAAKLYYHFDRFEKNGAIGIAITILLYVVTVFTASTVLYMYFLRIHNNGRLMDVYHRLHAKEDEFFIPYDLELCNEELNYVCKKAEQWRGEEGERRKVAVYDYIWEEEQIDEANMGEDTSRKKQGHREITTHVSVHTLHLDGLRELYRHFLRLPDGAIVEVFGEMGVAGMDESIKQALVKGTSYQGVDNTAASRSTLRSRKRAGSTPSEISFRRPSVLLEVPKTAGGPRSPSPV